MYKAITEVMVVAVDFMATSAKACTALVEDFVNAPSSYFVVSHCMYQMSNEGVTAHHFCSNFLLELKPLPHFVGKSTIKNDKSLKKLLISNRY